MKKKILFTIGSLSGGGAERVISILANRLSIRYDVTILAIFKDDIAYELSDNVKYTYLSLPDNLSGIRRNFVRLIRIRKTINELRPDIIISFLTIINMILLASLVFTKYPIIVSERNDPNSEMPNKVGRIIRDFLYYTRKGLFFVFQTPYARNCFKRMTNRNSTIIFNPIKGDMLAPYEGDREKRIVCVARLEPAKNLSMLIKAFYNFHKLYPDYHLEFYGKGPQEHQLKELVNQLQLTDSVTFRGFVRNVHAQIHKSSMFVLPSNYEGIANAMLEALAMGIPTICTDCPAYGARLFIEDGESGFLVPVGREDELLQKMKLLAEDNELSKRFSKKSKNIRDILNEDRIVEQWLKVIGGM
ncbi:glycosyltransferase family 4 protein [Streptococcus suis]|nr:glycosyltransferase family 4 protein [Streptococcus suis]